MVRGSGTRGNLIIDWEYVKLGWGWIIKVGMLATPGEGPILLNF